MRSFPYKPREPRVPPEAAEPEAPAVQDRKFLVRMLVFVVLALWIGLRTAVRFAVSGATSHPLAAALVVGDALVGLVIMTIVLSWISTDNFLRRYLKESFLEALGMFAAGFLMLLFLILVWIIFRV